VRPKYTGRNWIPPHVKSPTETALEEARNEADRAYVRAIAERRRAGLPDDLALELLRELLPGEQSGRTAARFDGLIGAIDIESS
jgi:hypothetical protein